MESTLDADQVIALLDLKVHPEGGFFRETFRDDAGADSRSASTRSASTAIYFLLKAGQVSRWHAVDAAEGWHHYAGAPLLLEIATPGGLGAAGPITRHHLGVDLVAGERPQAIVPPHYWQRAQSLGAWTLVGCTVAPGFEFSGFVMAPPELNFGRE